jgi:hypothetical protein
MRLGPRVLFACLLLFAAVCSSAHAASSLNVYVDNPQVSLGESTTLAAHAQTDESFGGGHIAFRYKPAAQDCAPTFADDTGTDATGPTPATVPAGPGSTDVGGQIVQLDTGSWRICGWLLDDVNGTVAAVGSVTVTVLPYSGRIRVSVQRLKHAVEVVLSYSTSSPAHLYAVLQRASRGCPRTPTRIRHGSVLVLPRSGRFVGSDGGLGRSIAMSLLRPGHWRVCTWLRADHGAAGPVTKRFSVPRQRRRRAGHAAG